MADARKTTLAGVGLLLALGAALTGHGGYLAAKAVVAQVLLDRAWERTLRDGAEHRPWPWADTHPVARLHVPSHTIRQVVLSGSSGRTLAFGPGHVAGTAPPGKRGLSMISGHRDTHFRFLERLEPGDALRIERPGATRRYIVRRTAIVDLEHEDLALDPTLDRLVLVTCYPFRQWAPGGSRRYVVVAGPVSGLNPPSIASPVPLYVGSKPRQPLPTGAGFEVRPDAFPLGTVGAPTIAVPSVDISGRHVGRKTRPTDDLQRLRLAYHGQCPTLRFIDTEPCP